MRTVAVSLDTIDGVLLRREQLDRRLREEERDVFDERVAVALRLKADAIEREQAAHDRDALLLVLLHERVVEAERNVQKEARR